MFMVESNKINEMRMECPVCLDIMRYRGKKVNVHTWVCGGTKVRSCPGVCVMSHTRALIAKDFGDIGRYVLVHGELEKMFVLNKVGRVDRKKSFNKMVAYMETNTQRLMELRAEYLGRKL